MDELRNEQEGMRMFLLNDDTKEDDASHEADCISLEYGLFEDIASKLDEFVRLNHLKKFVEAKELYQSGLINHQDWFPVVAEFAEHLLQQGFYEELVKFSEKHLKVTTESRELQVLILMGVIANIHLNQTYQDALAQISVIWHVAPIDYSKEMPIDTEIHILELLLQAAILIERYRGPMLVNVDSLPQFLRETGWEYFITWSRHLFDNGYYWEAHRIFRWLLEVLPLSKAKGLLKGNLEAARRIRTRNEALEIAISASLQVFMQHLDGSGNPDDSKWNDFVLRIAFGHLSGYKRKQSHFESNDWVLKRLQDTIDCPLPLNHNQEDEAESSHSFTYETQHSVDLTEAWDLSYRNIDATFRTVVKAGDVPLVKSLLKEGADLESEDFFQQRPLHLAAANGKIEIVRILVDGCAKIECEDWFRQKPIYLAAKNGHDSVVQLLLHLHEDKTDFYGLHSIWDKALRCAVEKGHETVVRVLLASRPEHTTFHPDVLTLAVRGGHKQVVKLLLEAEPDLDMHTRDIWEWTPLMSAIDEGHDAIIELLEEKGLREILSQPDYNDGHKEKPLLYAIKQGHDALVSALLGQEVWNPKSESDQNQPSVATTSAYEKRAKLLLELSKIEVNAGDKKDRTALSYAAEKENENIVKALLGHPDIEVNIQDSRGRTALSYAVEKENENIVKALLEHPDIKVNIQDKEGRTALVYAASNGIEKVVITLLEYEGIEVAIEDKEGQTVLLQAKVLKSLLEHGMIETEDPHNNLLLSWAAKWGCHGLVKLLLENCIVDVNFRIGSFARTPLLWSAKNGNEKNVRILLEKDGIEADAQDYFGQTPLSYAAEHGHLLVAHILLHRDDINADSRDVNRTTPLMYATISNHVDVVQLLLRKGPGIYAQSESCGHAIRIALVKGHMKIMELLLKYGVNVSAKYYGDALQTASYEGHQEIVKLLLERGADLNALAGSFRTPWFEASIRGDRKIVELLLEHGAEMKYSAALTALHAAARGSHEEIVKLLLERGADINALAEIRGTALFEASLRGDKKIVEVLLERGTGINSPSQYYKNALEAALAGAHPEIVRLLRQKLDQESK